MEYYSDHENHERVLGLCQEQKNMCLLPYCVECNLLRLQEIMEENALLTRDALSISVGESFRHHGRGSCSIQMHQLIVAVPHARIELDNANDQLVCTFLVSVGNTPLSLNLGILRFLLFLSSHTIMSS